MGKGQRQPRVDSPQGHICRVVPTGAVAGGHLTLGDFCISRELRIRSAVRQCGEEWQVLPWPRGRMPVWHRHTARAKPGARWPLHVIHINKSRCEVVLHNMADHRQRASKRLMCSLLVSRDLPHLSPTGETPGRAAQTRGRVNSQMSSGWRASSQSLFSNQLHVFLPAAHTFSHAVAFPPTRQSDKTPLTPCQGLLFRF